MPLRGIVLLGWMNRDAAVKYLREECIFDPPLTEQDAEARWAECRARVEALPERDAPAPAQIDMSSSEDQRARLFLRFMRSIGARDVQQVIKIDPMQLVARQYYVVVERSEDYGRKCETAEGWMKEALPTTLTNPQVTIRFTQRNFDSEADIDLPHGEFYFGPNPDMSFGPVQFLRHVTALRAGQRMLLWAGYHRLYSRMLNITPTAADRSALVALTSNCLVPPPNSEGVTTPTGDPSLDVFCRRPALFADFFADGLFIQVNLRRKRFQLQVRSKWVQLYDE